MARLNRNGNEGPIYDAAHQFVQAALRQDGSLFTPGNAIWAPQPIDDLYARLVTRPDPSLNDSFDVKLERQLRGAPPETIQLAAELLYVHLLVPRDIAGGTKRALITKILSWMHSPVAIPPQLDTLLDGGLVAGGYTFTRRRHYQLSFLLEFARAWKRLTPAESTNALADAWAFKAMVAAVPLHSGYGQRETLLHLVFPDDFECISSLDHKQRLARHFADLAPGVEDIDRRLAAIRQHLEPELGVGFSFYDRRLCWRWNPDYYSDPWDHFTFWAARFYEGDDFDARERDYKLRVAERVRAAREAVVSDDPSWRGRLKDAFGSPNNLTNHYNHGKFLDWCTSAPEDARGALMALWGKPNEAMPDIGAFLERVPATALSGRGTRLNIASFLAAAHGPERYPVYRRTALETAFKLTGYPVAPTDADEAALYQHALAFFDEIVERLGERNLRLRDRLDAQSVVWCVTQWNADQAPIRDWPDRAAFLAYRAGAPPDQELDEDEPERASAPETAAPRPAAWLFQGSAVANPELLGNLANARPGQIDYWRVSRYASEIRVGDPVVLWVAGPSGGIYALGEITRAPYERDLPAWDRVAPDAEATEKAIDFRYTRVLAEPIRRSVLYAHPTLKHMGVLQIARQTNYRLTGDEWIAIQELVNGVLATAEPLPTGYQPPTFDQIRARIEAVGMRMPERTLRRYHLALQTRGFVILSGLSGSGKTWLAEAYAEAMGTRLMVAPVAPNWTSNEDLLGYFNPLSGAYHDTAVSRFLREADQEQARADATGVKPRPYHLVLDEMNLARVEYYFARFLSVMEVRARTGQATIELGPNDSVRLSGNLYVVGTVNVDETTHGFADKVYDRAQLIEIEAPRDELVAHLGGAPYAAALLDVWDAVHGVAPFAFRVLDEIRHYGGAASNLGVPWEEALDEQLLQKVLPKLKGAATRVEQSLEKLVALTRDDFPLTHAKARRMLEDARSHGFASYF